MGERKKAPLRPLQNQPAAGLRSGTDLIATARVRRLLAENPGAWLGLTTPEERLEWRGERAGACLLAAKEAVLKVLDVGADEADWREIEVAVSPSCRLQFSGQLAQAAAALGSGHWFCCTAAAADLAIAWVVWQPHARL